jgi:hypothetical protein
MSDATSINGIEISTSGIFDKSVLTYNASSDLLSFGGLSGIASVGDNSEIIFNDSGATGSDIFLSYNKNTGLLTLGALSAGIVFGEEITTTVLVPTPTYKRIYTIPDVGANATFILTPGTATKGDILYYNGTNWSRLPAGNNGLFLKSNGPGTNPSWAAGGGGGSGTPGGNDTEVQFNDGSTFGGDSAFTWNKNTDTLTATNIVAGTAITVSNISGLLKASTGSVGLAAEGTDYYSAANVDIRRAWRSSGFSSFTEPVDNGNGTLTIATETVRLYNDSDNRKGLT